MWNNNMGKDLFGLGSCHCMHERGREKKQFRRKSENGSHNSSLILFTVDRKENSIRLGSGKYPYGPTSPLY